jgi:hypothetical protein
MNAFRLTDVQMPSPELRLERYHALGYDVDVAREDERVIITVEAKKEGYKCRMVFQSSDDADRWDKGSDAVKPETEVTRTTLAFVVAPLATRGTIQQDVEPVKEELIPGPRRVIEV